jgi:hypothetical protein
LSRRPAPIGQNEHVEGKERIERIKVSELLKLRVDFPSCVKAAVKGAGGDRERERERVRNVKVNLESSK